MISLSVSANFKNVIRALEKQQKQVRFATAKALTFTAERVEKAVYAEFRSRFDRPTPMTMRSLRKKSANVHDLMAMVYVKDRALGGKNNYSMAEILAHQFSGGHRLRKGIEYHLTRSGYLDASDWLVPAAGAKLDRYGNMSRGQIAQIMSQLKIGLDPYSRSSDSRRSKRNVAKAGKYFWSGGKAGVRAVGIMGGEMTTVSIFQNHLPRGIWLRKGRNNVIPVMIAVKRPSYKRRIDLKRIAERIVDKEFDPIFNRVLDKELRGVLK